MNENELIETAKILSELKGYSMDFALEVAREHAEMDAAEKLARKNAVEVTINEKGTSCKFIVLKETEKAIEISVFVMIETGGFRTGIWMPKSMTGAGWFFGKKCRELEKSLFSRYGKPARVVCMVGEDGTA